MNEKGLMSVRIGTEFTNDINIYSEPWVAGTRPADGFFDVNSHIFIKDEEIDSIAQTWIFAEHKLIESLKKKARFIGANSVLDLDIVIDPFAQGDEVGVTGIFMYAEGKAARLISRL